MISQPHKEVQKHYDRYPYPDYPLYALGRWEDLGGVDFKSWGVQHEIQDAWLAGCGTIQPLMLGRRNPSVRIIASDLSKRSLRRSKWRCLLYGVRNVHFVCEDIATSIYRDAFDLIDCYGVLHHTENPEQALKNLSRALRQGGVMRLMIYSAEARATIENLRSQVQKNKLDSVKAVKGFLSQQNVQIQGDLKSNRGIADALLHPLVHVFRQDEIEKLVASAPELEVMERLFEGNFIYFLRKNGT